MKLLAILLCLGLERFLHAGAFLYRFNWFNWYLEKFHKFLGSPAPWRNYLEIAIVIFPLLIGVSVIYYVSCYWLYGWLKFLAGAVILLYCLGPENFYRTRDLTVQDIFSRANHSMFAVLFWFALFGPVAAVLYRMVSLLKRAAQQPAYSSLAVSTEIMQSVLDWLPTRFFSLCFALVGNFVKAFNYWIDMVATGWSRNHEVLESCGRLALGLEPNLPLAGEVLTAAYSLVDRTLIVFVVIVAAFTLGAWL